MFRSIRENSAATSKTDEFYCLCTAMIYSHLAFMSAFQCSMAAMTSSAINRSIRMIISSYLTFTPKRENTMTNGKMTSTCHFEQLHADLFLLQLLSWHWFCSISPQLLAMRNITYKLLTNKKPEAFIWSKGMFFIQALLSLALEIGQFRRNKGQHRKDALSTKKLAGRCIWVA